MWTDRRCRRIAWVGLGLLLAAGSVCGQVIELGGPPPAPEAAEAPTLSPDEARVLAALPNCRSSSFRRSFDRQVIRIDIFRFEQPEAAFSLFTFMQRPGAKPFSGLVGCYLQGQEMVVWLGNAVVRTVFDVLVRAHLSEYYEWLSDQFKSRDPVPDLFQQLPADNMDRPSRRYLVRDGQLALVAEGGAVVELGLDRNGRLAVARYRGAGGAYWAGWLAPASTDDAARLLARGESAAAMPRLKRVGERIGFYLGPADPESVGAAFARLEAAARYPATVGEIDLTRFFRRDDYTYSGLILAALRFVGLTLLMALAVGLLVRGAIVGFRRIRRRPDGLADEHVVRLKLDGVTGTRGDSRDSGTQPPPPGS